MLPVRRQVSWVGVRKDLVINVRVQGLTVQTPLEAPLGVRGGFRVVRLGTAKERIFELTLRSIEGHLDKLVVFLY